MGCGASKSTADVDQQSPAATIASPAPAAVRMQESVAAGNVGEEAVVAEDKYVISEGNPSVSPEKTGPSLTTSGNQTPDSPGERRFSSQMAEQIMNDGIRSYQEANGISTGDFHCTVDTTTSAIDDDYDDDLQLPAEKDSDRQNSGNDMQMLLKFALEAQADQQLLKMERTYDEDKLTSDDEDDLFTAAEKRELRDKVKQKEARKKQMQRRESSKLLDAKIHSPEVEKERELISDLLEKAAEAKTDQYIMAHKGKHVEEYETLEENSDDDLFTSAEKADLRRLSLASQDIEASAG